MPLTVILGRVGCGKTAYMADEMIRTLDADPSARITLIVPDQYTVASEQYMLSRLGEKRSRRLNITSLKSLARTEFAAHGISTRFLGEGGKTVLLKKAFDAVSPSLTYYPASSRNSRFLPLVLGAIKELKAAGISADQLMETAKREGNEKLYDLSMVWQVYEELLSEGYFDPDDAPARLKKLLEETGDFEQETVYVANFRTFYNRERNILLQLIQNGAHLTVSLPTDTTDPFSAGPTADAAEEARKLIALCRALGEDCKTVNLQSQASFSSPEFALLEGEWAHPTGKTFPTPPEHIHLFCGADRFDEGEWVAAEIARKVREEGYRYGDFTVIVRSLDDYAGVLDPMFDQYEIPLFYHRKTPLRQRNPMPLFSALFSMVCEGWSKDAVLAFVKSGFFADEESAAWFERYVTVWGISYNRFKTPFTRPIAGFTNRETEEEVAMREKAEELRRRLVDTVDRFAEATEQSTVRGISTALYRLAEELRLSDRLEENAANYRDYGEYELAARQKKVYEQFLLALDELVLTAGDDPVTRKEYRDLFFAVIDTHDVAILPTSLDEVTAGSPETLPMISPRCVFVLGLNEGVFPRNLDDNRLLTDRDREQLSEFGIGETTDDKILHELFYLYLSLTAPREELYLSYASVIGGEAFPSAAVEQICNLFPGLTAERFRPSDPDGLTKRIQRERAAFALHTKTPVEELGKHFASTPEYAQVLSRRETNQTLSPDLARRLYPDRLSISASRADKFHQCPYAYFLRYGLSIFPRQKAEFNPNQRGNIVHEALETILSQGLDGTDEDLHQRVLDFGEAYLKKLYGDETPPASMVGYFNSLLRKIEKLLSLFRKEMQASEFVPYAFEQKIDGSAGAVPPVVIDLDRGSLAMTGVVDRVDVYEKDGVTYLRVVDYKTGQKHFSFDKINHGIEVQMLMYLYALQQHLFPGQTCLPAGVQYVGANPKTVKGDRREDPEKLTVLWESETPRSGVFLNDGDILRAMDSTEDRYFLRIKKNNSPYLITLNRFGELFEQICQTLQAMGNALHRGEIGKKPIRIHSDYESCRFCDLRETCRHPEPRNVLTRPEEQED